MAFSTAGILRILLKKAHGLLWHDFFFSKSLHCPPPEITPFFFLMLSNLTFNNSLQNFPRKQILHSRAYSCHFFFLKSQSALTPLLWRTLCLSPHAPCSTCRMGHLGLGPGSGPWRVAQGGTHTTLILRAALLCVLVETGHFTRATRGS